MLRDAQKFFMTSLESQENSHANPQLEERLLGTGIIFTSKPSFFPARSNISAILVVLKVARHII